MRFSRKSSRQNSFNRSVVSFQDQIKKKLVFRRERKPRKKIFSFKDEIIKNLQRENQKKKREINKFAQILQDSSLKSEIAQIIENQGEEIRHLSEMNKQFLDKITLAEKRIQLKIVQNEKSFELNKSNEKIIEGLKNDVNQKTIEI